MSRHALRTPAPLGRAYLHRRLDVVTGNVRSRRCSAARRARPRAIQARRNRAPDNRARHRSPTTNIPAPTRRTPSRRGKAALRDATRSSDHAEIEHQQEGAKPNPQPSAGRATPENFALRPMPSVAAAVATSAARISVDALPPTARRQRPNEITEVVRGGEPCALRDPSARVGPHERQERRESEAPHAHGEREAQQSCYRSGACILRAMARARSEETPNRVYSHAPQAKNEKSR